MAQLDPPVPEEAVAVLRELWPDVDRAEIRSWREADDYRLFAAYTGGDGDGSEELIVGVAGVSVQRVLHHVRHAWVHDLVVAEGHRSRGHGAALLDAVEAWARRENCAYVALGLVAGNDDAGRFYEREGYERWGDVYETEL